MEKKDKLIKLLRSYNVLSIKYRPDFDCEADTPDGDLLIEGDENTNLIADIYRLYTHNGLIAEDQQFCVVMAPKDSKLYKEFAEVCTEVLDASL